MKKILLTLILFIIPVFFTNSYAKEFVQVKVPLNLKTIGLDCSAESTYFICKIETGFASVSTTIGQIIKYFTFITGLAGVLYIIYNGIKLSMAGLNQSYKDEAKKDIEMTLIGLVLLLLSGVILNFIAPWIYK